MTMAALGILATSSGAALMVSAGPAAADEAETNVCHATSSDTQPYEFIQVGDASAHYDHVDRPTMTWKSSRDGHVAGEPKPDLVDGYRGAVVRSAEDCPRAGAPVVEGPPKIEQPAVMPPPEFDQDDDQDQDQAAPGELPGGAAPGSQLSGFGSFVMGPVQEVSGQGGNAPASVHADLAETPTVPTVVSAGLSDVSDLRGEQGLALLVAGLGLIAAAGRLVRVRPAPRRAAGR